MLPQNTPQTSPTKNQSGVKTRDLIIVFLSHWYWFVISILIMMSVAYFVIRSTRPLYTRTASILIKDVSKGQSLATDASGFANVGIFASNTDLNNEIYQLQSPAIMLEVVKRLNLQQYYDVQGMFHAETLYGSNLPIRVEMPDVTDLDLTCFFLDIDKQRHLKLFNFSRNNYPFSDVVIEGEMYDTLATPLGRVYVEPSRFYYTPDRSIEVHHNLLQTTLNAYQEKLTVSTARDNSTIINLTLIDYQPQRAEEVLSTIIAIYKENWIRDRNQVAISTNQFITERIAVIERELQDVESHISSFKSQHLILGDAEANAGVFLDATNSADIHLADLNKQLYLAQNVRDYLSNEENLYQLLPAFSGMDNILSQIKEYNTAILRRNSLVSASSLQNPLVKDLDKELEVLRASLLSSIDNYIESLRTEISITEKRMRQNADKVAASPNQAQYLLSIERQQKVKESLYLFLLQKREENELSQAFTAYNSRVVTPPSGSNIPTSPIQRNIYLLFLLIGIAIPAIMLILGEFLNNTVRGRKDLEVISIPFLGEIPLAKQKRTFREKVRIFLMRYVPYRLRPKRDRKEDKTLHILVKDKSRDVINEAFRVIRTNLEFMAASEEGGRVIMLTSFNPNSGKTFIACNLALSLAINNKRVLVIDMDMRKTSLSALVNKPKEGLSLILGGYRTDYQSLIQTSTFNEQLQILPVGTIPPNPTELLYSPILGNMLSELRKQYDYIFLDCPPLEIVADATIVSPLADMSIFVIRAELLEREALPELEKYYTEGRLKKMSIILNGTTDAFSRYGYHRYGSRYGYGYGHRYGYSYRYGYRYGYGDHYDDDDATETK